MENNKLIYVLEDNISLNQLFVFRLKNKKYSVEGFTEPELFLKALKTKQPNLVIIDLILPTISGEEIISHIREKYKRDILIIAVSAKTLSNDVVETFKLGIDDYIKKPVDVKELIARIEGLLKKHEEIEKECKDKVEEIKEEHKKENNKRKRK